jgi:hypothetical protein
MKGQHIYFQDEDQNKTPDVQPANPISMEIRYIFEFKFDFKS